MKKKIIISQIFNSILILCCGFTSTASFSISGYVPEISRIIQLPNNQVKLQANFPRIVNVTNGYLTNCDLNSMILDVVCDIVPDDSGLPIVIEINVKE